VISGYLMTSIIMERLAKGTFDIRNFYYERAKRIVPEGVMPRLRAASMQDNSTP
jgi:hypothetical protein